MVVFRVLGSSVSGHARTVANLIVGVRGTVVTDVGVLVIFDTAGVGQVHSAGQGKGGGMAGFHGQGVGGDEWCSIGGCSWSGSDVCFDRESFTQERQW